MEMNRKFIVLVLFFVLVLLFSYQQGFFNQFFALSGTSTLSVSNLSLQSSNPFFSGKAIQVTFTANNKINQSYFGTLTAQEINNAIQGQEKVSKGFKANLENLSSWCEYNLIQQPLSLYDYGVIYKDLGCIFCSDADADKILPDCQPYGEIVAYGRVSDNDYTAFCVYRNLTSSIKGNIQTIADNKFSAQATFQVEGEGKQFKDISSTQQSIWFPNESNPIAFWQWQGNLTSGSWCEAPQDKGITTVYRNGEYILTEEELINGYKAIEGEIVSLPYRPSSGYINQRTNNVNAYLNAIYAGSSWQPFNSDGFAFIEAGKIKYYLNELASFPVFSLYVKADALGIHTNVPEAKINFVKGTSFGDGSQSSIEVNLTNIGGEAGSFLVGLDCIDDWVNDSATRSAYFNANQTYSVFVPVTGSCSTTQTTQCRASITVLGSTVYSNYVNVTCQPNQTCIPNQKSCIENKVQQCNAEGTGWLVLNDCEAQGKTCGSISGQLTCISGEGEPDPVSCPLGFEWRETQTKEFALFGDSGTGLFGTGFLGTHTVTVAGCEPALWVYLAVFFVLIILVLFIVFGGKK
jgi:hypothetical protein